jgi:hypothetical protein
VAAVAAAGRAVGTGARDAGNGDEEEEGGEGGDDGGDDDDGGDGDDEEDGGDGLSGLVLPKGKGAGSRAMGRGAPEAVSAGASPFSPSLPSPSSPSADGAVVVARERSMTTADFVAAAEAKAAAEATDWTNGGQGHAPTVGLCLQLDSVATAKVLAHHAAWLEALREALVGASLAAAAAAGGDGGDASGKALAAAVGHTGPAAAADAAALGGACASLAARGAWCFGLLANLPEPSHRDTTATVRRLHVAIEALHAAIVATGPGGFDRAARGGCPAADTAAASVSTSPAPSQASLGGRMLRGRDEAKADCSDNISDGALGGETVREGLRALAVVALITGKHFYQAPAERRRSPW